MDKGRDAMDSVKMLQRVVDQTSSLVEGTTEADLSKSTPCAEWTVKDLINHITGGSTMFALSAETGSVPDDMVGQLLGGDNLGADYKGAFKTATTRALAAFELPGVMDKIVKLPFGEMPAGIALNIAIFDVATHACDLAKAMGTSVTDDELMEEALAIGKQMIGPELRAPGMFDEATPISDAASASDRLLAFAGRKL
jgi:uncharacterized protein (TIGR03086 family)